MTIEDSQIIRRSSFVSISRTWLTMGFTREIVKHGKGDQKPKEGDEITVQYFGCLYNEVTDLPGEW